MASGPATQANDHVAHALAGAGGGIVSMALTYPLITLSTRAQLESKRAQSSVPDAVRRIVQREGIIGLYSGLASALFGISVTNFVYYYWYEWTRAALEKAALKAGRANKKLGTLEYMLTGAIAGCATVLITNPIWVINTRIMARKQGSTGRDHSESEKRTLPSTVGTLISLVRTEGLVSLFKGVLPALVLVANPILQYTIFEQLRNMLAKRRKVTSTDAFYMGAIGKLLATTITYPYITLKSRMHVAAKDDAAPNTLEGLRQIVRDEGWAGLYNGIVPKITQSVLTAALLFAFKDALYQLSIRARRRYHSAFRAQ